MNEKLMTKNILDWAFDYNRKMDTNGSFYSLEEAVDRTVSYFSKHLHDTRLIDTLKSIQGGCVYNDTENEWYLFSWCCEDDNGLLSLRPSGLVLLDIAAALS
jgi:hypothetical protein